ncbi:hypothetical protein [Kocuria nitroreducens]|uniref:hypothetical protein n=1 Tax=Kocuria nitroreducens TaxID=3058914 RepID=UPI0036D93B97
MSAAALSVLLGAGLVAASHLVTVLVARATAGADGPVAAPALAMTYVLKVLLLGWVLLTVPAPPWLSPGWVGVGVLTVLVVSLALAARAGARGTRAALGPVLEARRETEARRPGGPGAAGSTDDREQDDRRQDDRRQDDHEHG